MLIYDFILFIIESRPPPPPLNVYLRSEGGNIIVTWLPPYPTENILVRNYAIEVYNNRTVRQKMLVGYKESSVIIYEAGTVHWFYFTVFIKRLSLHSQAFS